MLSLWLELTPRCNLKCLFCYNDWRHLPAREQAIPLEATWWNSQIARLITKHKFDYVALSGGEPLLYRGLDDVVSYLAAQGERSILTTNGVLFREDRASALYHSGLREVQVALHSASPDIHDTLAGRGSWDGAVRCIIVALSLGIEVAVTFVRTDSNSAQVAEIVSLAGALGVRRLVVNDVQNVGYARRNEDLVRPAAMAGRSDARAREVAHGEANGVTVVHIPGSLPAVPGSRPWHRLAITPAGELKLCNLSVRTLGRVDCIDDLVLDGIVADLAKGDIRKFERNVDSCYCFERELLAG